MVLLSEILIVITKTVMFEKRVIRCESCWLG